MYLTSLLDSTQISNTLVCPNCSFVAFSGMATNSSPTSFNCTDCAFSSSSQGGLNVHRAKYHIDLSVKTVSVVRLYPEEKYFICCICDSKLKSFQLFKRHLHSFHPNTTLESSALCSICNKSFKSTQRAGAHYKRDHHVPMGESTEFQPSSPTPIRSFIKCGPVAPDVPSPLSTLVVSDSKNPPPTRDLMTPSTPSSYHLTSTLDDRCPLPAPPSTRRRRLSTTNPPVFFPPMSSPRPSPPSRPVHPTCFDVSDLQDDQQQPVSSSPDVSPQDVDVSSESFASCSRPSASNTERLEAFREKWSTSFGVESPWIDFCDLCSTFTSEARALAIDVISPTTRRPVPRDPNRPSAKKPPIGRPPIRNASNEARRLQSLYRHSKKRAARMIIGDESPTYSGSVSDVESFFENIFAEKPCDTSALKSALNDTVPSVEVDDSLFNPPSADEIRRKLHSAANTSPGPDRIEYRHLKRVDPTCQVLSVIFARCFQQRDVPPAWKSAATILIYKKGAPDDASNFRPIALMSCVYKLLMGVLAKRISSWAIENDLLSSEQKSARPSEGCYEHTYLLQSVIADARRQPKKLNLAWLDLRNAFGSIPHSVIRVTLSHMGLPLPLVDMVMNAYSGATTSIRTPTGDSNPVPVNAGVKQGCPLSPILFNLCIELILRSVKSASAACRGGPPKHFKVPVSVLAYADDLVFIARKKEQLDALLAAASSAANTLGLSFRPDKCATLSLSSKSGNNVTADSFQIQDQVIPSLSSEESYRYLGVPIGLIHNIDDLPSLLPKLINDLEKIGSSLLAPWQKLDAIRTFVQPCLTFALRAGNPLKKSLVSYRSTLIRILRHTCSLPNNSAVSYFFASKSCGGLAFQDPFNEMDIQTITQAIKILSCPDRTVAEIAHAELTQTVSKAARSSAPTPALINNFLSAAPDERLNEIRYRVQSLWSRTRKACRRLKVSFSVPNNAAATVQTETSGPINAKNTCRFLHCFAQTTASEQLQSLPDQGKVARSLATDQYANGSTWQFTGLNLRFRDWRFIHRARLNCLPLNAIKSRWSNSSPKCRHCSSDETLPHTICHCRTNMVAILARHNKVVDRLVNSVRHGQVITDRTVAGSGCNLRPDIVIRDDNKVTIIDVCCPFENGPEALQDAENRKVTKYQPLQQFFSNQGLQCDVFGFVIGSLGAWHPSNESVLRKLEMSRTYKSLFRKLCCSDIIQGSSDIYRQHLGITDVVNVPDLSHAPQPTVVLVD